MILSFFHVCGKKETVIAGEERFCTVTTIDLETERMNVTMNIIISKPNEEIEVREVDGQNDIYSIMGNDAIMLEMIPELDIYALANEDQYEEADYKVESKQFGDLTNKYSLTGTSVILTLDAAGNYAELNDEQIEAVRQLQEVRGGNLNS